MFNRMEVDDMDKENVWDTAEDMGMLYEFDQTGEPETGEADGVVSIEDSFVMSMRNKGYVDLDYMSDFRARRYGLILTDIKRPKTHRYPGCQDSSCSGATSIRNWSQRVCY